MSTAHGSVDSVDGGTAASDPHQVRKRPTPASPARNRFTELDGLRGVAALAVIFFHLRDYVLRLHPPDVIGEWVGGSYLMVDLFFVLSGFVLSKKMLSTDSWGDVRRFSLMRIRRFAPLHLVAWSIALVLVFLTLFWQLSGSPDAPARDAFTRSSQTPWAWFSSLFLLQGFVGPEFSGYSAAWSLSIELWCNVLIVAGIALIGLLTGSSRWKWLVGPIAALAGAVLLSLRDNHDPNTLGFIGAGRGTLGLGVGMIVSQAYLLTMRRQHRLHGEGGSSRLARTMAGSAAGLAMLALLSAMYWSHIVKREHFLWMAPVAALCVYSLALPSGGPLHRFFNSRLTQWLGSRSFALYALHGPVLLTIEWALHFLGYHPLRLASISGLVILAELTGALIAAEIGHRYIERSWEKRAAARRQPPGPARHARSGGADTDPDSGPENSPGGSTSDVLPVLRPEVDLRGYPGHGTTGLPDQEKPSQHQAKLS